MSTQTIERPLAGLAQVALATYRDRPWRAAERGMKTAQRAEMILRFHKRKMALEPHSLEHHICACVVLALLYGGSVRTINGISKRTRARWSTQDV